MARRQLVLAFLNMRQQDIHMLGEHTRTDTINTTEDTKQQQQQQQPHTVLSKREWRLFTTFSCILFTVLHKPSHNACRHNTSIFLFLSFQGKLLGTLGVLQPWLWLHSCFSKFLLGFPCMVGASFCLWLGVLCKETTVPVNNDECLCT